MSIHDDYEPINCGTFRNLPETGRTWPQCECLRFNPPEAKTCARCGATPPKPQAPLNQRDAVERIAMDDRQRKPFWRW